MSGRSDLTSPDDFHGEVVLITGAGSGIGAELARRFGAAGAAVVVLDLDIDAAGGVAAGIPGAISIGADVTDRAAMAAAFARVRTELGDVTVLVNNAMTCSDADFLDMTVAEWSRDLDVNLTAAFTAAQLALPPMLARGAGAIVNITSVNAIEFLGNHAYSAAKAGLIALTRGLAVRFGREGVRANAVAPGTIVTPAWDARLAADPGVLERTRQWYPSDRLGAPHDIAEAVLFLASSRAGWINGETLVVDGGLLAGDVGMANGIVSGVRADDED